MEMKRRDCWRNAREGGGVWKIGNQKLSNYLMQGGVGGGVQESGVENPNST